MCYDSAQVMLLRNWIDHTRNINLCNGSRGVLTRFTAKGVPVVKFVNGRELEIEQHVWEYYRGPNNKPATRSQLPLALAWVRSTLSTATIALVD